MTTTLGRWAFTLAALPIGLLAAGVIAAAGTDAPLRDPHADQWRTGDIIFLDGMSFRSRVVRLLQGYDSDYSHVGIVVVDGYIPYIVHADPSEDRVLRERWDAVIRSANVSGGAVYRVRGLSRQAAGLAGAAALGFVRDAIRFDHDFDLADADRLYCTELVLSALRTGGTDLHDGASSSARYLLPADLLDSDKLDIVVRF